MTAAKVSLADPSFLPALGEREGKKEEEGEGEREKKRERDGRKKRMGQEAFQMWKVLCVGVCT